MLDLQKIASDHGTCIRSTFFGAVAASGALPLDLNASRSVLAEGQHSAGVAGFDAAALALTATDNSQADTGTELTLSTLEQLISYATAELIDYQDEAYAKLYNTRLNSICELDGAGDELKEEVARRLANWMMYEDIPRFADLITRPQRYAQI